MSRAVPDVKTLIIRRMAGKKDGYKLAMVCEGGSLRGVTSLAYLARLEQQGLNRIVDMWGGTSSGGMNAAYGAAGCARLGASIYPDTLGPRGFYNDGKSHRFINFWRVLKAPVMDVAGMVDVVFDHVKPLDYAALKKAKVPVWVTACGRDGKLHVLRLDGRGKDEIRHALKSTARIPLVAHRLGDTEVLWDGGLSGHNLPLDVARRMGATHVLVLRAHPEGSKGAGAELLERLVIAPLVRLRARDLYGLLMTRLAKGQQVLDRLKGDPTVWVLAPKEDLVGAGEQDMGKMWRAALAAWQQVERAFGLPKAKLPPEWVYAGEFIEE